MPGRERADAGTATARGSARSIGARCVMNVTFVG